MMPEVLDRAPGSLSKSPSVNQSCASRRLSSTGLGKLHASNTIGFAVLATENAIQPHTSLIAITALDDGQRIVLAKYHNTRKFTNLTQNQRYTGL